MVLAPKSHNPPQVPMSPSQTLKGCDCIGRLKSVLAPTSPNLPQVPGPHLLGNEMGAGGRCGSRSNWKKEQPAQLNKTTPAAPLNVKPPGKRRLSCIITAHLIISNFGFQHHKATKCGDIGLQELNHGCYAHNHPSYLRDAARNTMRQGELNSLAGTLQNKSITLICSGLMNMSKVRIGPGGHAGWFEMLIVRVSKSIWIVRYFRGFYP